jgi:hypothetical protein
MRLWSVHPKYLDARGLVALWREGLLAQAVLRGLTRGYRHHPQLARFRSVRSPVASVARYLHAVCDEAEQRGYRFDRRKLGRRTRGARIALTSGQLEYEWRHLKAKLRLRDRRKLAEVRRVARPDAHPSFRVVPGPVAEWEVVTRRTMAARP